MDKGRKRFNQDKKQRRPEGGRSVSRPDIRRDREDDAFAKEGIEIPFNYVNVVMKDSKDN